MLATSSGGQILNPWSRSLSLKVQGTGDEEWILMDMLQTTWKLSWFVTCSVCVVSPCTVGYCWILLDTVVFLCTKCFLSCLADSWGRVPSGILRDGPRVCPCLLDAARLQIPSPTHHWRRWYDCCWRTRRSLVLPPCLLYITHYCIYTGEEETQAAFRKHFEQQLDLYQEQVITQCRLEWGKLYWKRKLCYQLELGNNLPTFRLNAPVVIRAKVESKQAIFRLKLVKDKPLKLYLLLTTIKGQ